MNIDAWLSSIGLAEYAEAFRTNHIDAEVLQSLSADDLKEIGVASLGHRKKLLEEIQKLPDSRREESGLGSIRGMSESGPSEPPSLDLSEFGDIGSRESDAVRHSQHRMGMWYMDNPHSSELGTKQTSVYHVFEQENENSLFFAVGHPLEIVAPYRSEIADWIRTYPGDAAEHSKLLSYYEAGFNYALAYGWHLFFWLKPQSPVIFAHNYQFETVRHYLKTVPEGVARMDLPDEFNVMIMDVDDSRRRTVAKWGDLVGRNTPSTSLPSGFRLDFGTEEQIAKVVREKNLDQPS